MRSIIIFTHPDLSGDESSLSSRREGEEGESIKERLLLVFYWISNFYSVTSKVSY